MELHGDAKYRQIARAILFRQFCADDARRQRLAIFGEFEIVCPRARLLRRLRLQHVLRGIFWHTPRLNQLETRNLRQIEHVRYVDALRSRFEPRIVVDAEIAKWVSESYGAGKQDSQEAYATVVISTRLCLCPHEF